MTKFMFVTGDERSHEKNNFMLYFMQGNGNLSLCINLLIHTSKTNVFLSGGRIHVKLSISVFLQGVLLSDTVAVTILDIKQPP